MAIRRASLILPCRRLEDFPTHLTGQSAAELLAAWTAVWHPALIHIGESLPKWHSADEPPDPPTLEGELVLVPPASRLRMSTEWFDRLHATQPQNPPPIDAVASRDETVAALLAAAEIDPNQIAADDVADFLALGHAYLQVELLTNAMRYTSVLDTHQFTSAVVAAASAAVAGSRDTIREELARAFDLLADARNHVYSVDFYIIDLTLLAPSTLGDSLRTKLAAGSQTSVLLPAELLDRMAREHPETLAELRRALDAGTVSIVGGMYHDSATALTSPESLLASLTQGQQAARLHLDRDYEIFGQYSCGFSHLLPEVLKSMGFRAALHVAFDGSRLPSPDQCKTNWGADHGSSIEAVAVRPLDANRPETWLKLGERIGDAISRDHVATILLASWPGCECEYFDDLRRAGRFNPVLGKLVTLDEYFRITREADEWTTFDPREYPTRPGAELGPNPISSRVAAYRRDVSDTHRQLAAGLMQVAGLAPPDVTKAESTNQLAINPWNFANSQFIGADPLEYSGATGTDSAPRLDPKTTLVNRTTQNSLAHVLPNVPACGYSTLDVRLEFPTVALADGLTLRNERLEVTVSQSTGGIQSLRTHRDRGTRVSQRLVFHQHGSTDWRRAQSDAEPRPLDTQMIADRVEITGNDELIGEISSHGRLLDSAGVLLARFTQRVRAVLGVSAIVVDVELQPERLPEGDIWKSYFASRLAWLDEPLTVRRGDCWTARETTRECIESPDWIEVSDGVQTITCFALGLPFHRRIGETWLDTLLLTAGEEQRRFLFALGLDQPYPTKTALGLMTAGKTSIAQLPIPPATPQGWFLHVAAKNILITHVEPLAAPRAGIVFRLLETEGRETHTNLAAFRPFGTAQITDFRGNPAGVLSVVDGRIQFDIGPHRWIQIEAEW